MSTAIQPTPKVLLVISDEYKSISIPLEQAGFKVEIVDSVSSAEGQLKTLKPDLLLIHSDMTGDHGLNFCQFVKASEISPRPIIVFLVDENKSNERIEVLRSGADDAVSYPLSGKEIAFRIMAHLRRRQETHVNLLTGLPDVIIANSVLEHT